MEIRKGTKDDIDKVAALYDTLNDYLDSHINYPGWKKGIYPIREDAEKGILENNLFVFEKEERIAGTIILNHEPEEVYNRVDWHNEFSYEDIFVIHTLAVHPEFLQQKIGKKLIDFALDYAKKRQMKAVRLDVYEKNTPAIHLYENAGFEYIDTVDLGYGMYGLDWFKLYQFVCL